MRMWARRIRNVDVSDICEYNTRGCTEGERLKKDGEMTPNNLVRIQVRLFSVKLKIWRHFFSDKTDGKQTKMTLNFTTN